MLLAIALIPASWLAGEFITMRRLELLDTTASLLQPGNLRTDAASRSLQSLRQPRADELAVFIRVAAEQPADLG